MVFTIIGLARSLDITITAEGVEETRQADLLRDEGCDVGQGYLFGPPVPLYRLSGPGLAVQTSPAPAPWPRRLHAEELT